MYKQLALYFFLLLVMGVTFYAIFLMSRSEQDRPSNLARNLNLLFIAYICAVVALTIIPSDRFRLNNSIPLVNYVPFVNTYKRYAMVTWFENYPGIKNFWQNFLGNILLFIPLGGFLALLFRKHFWSVILIAVLSSCGIELLQYLSRYFGYYRHIDIDDVILNTCGAVFGYLLYRGFLWVKKTKTLF